MNAKHASSKIREPTPDHVDHGTPFNQMTQPKKVAFVVKVLVCALSFGFIFSDVMNS